MKLSQARSGVAEPLEGSRRGVWNSFPALPEEGAHEAQPGGHSVEAHDTPRGEFCIRKGMTFDGE